ncbi:MAG TPA: glycosyltransferase [Chitinophagaceae bacterium]
MNPATTRISIIIPTHNRAPRAKTLLDKLALQTYSRELMEVIMVANSCTDDTVAMLQQYKAPFVLKYAETGTSSPAAPRNKGASMAAGEILIFIDDDVEPRDDLAAEHVKAHEDDRSVVIGYLPLATSGKLDYYRQSLKMWWENKFQQMRRTGYRFGYEDLLSGNFSVSSKLFHEINGFVTTLRCRDDYELGIRLLEAGANFKFCYKAKGFHCDEVTNLDRSLKRKREEGRMDVHLWRIHPEVTTPLQEEYRKRELDFPRSRRAYLMMHYPRLTDWLANMLHRLLKKMERWKMRERWHRLSYQLHTYWYYKGLLDELHTKQGLLQYFYYTPPVNATKELNIDLDKGIEAAEELLDRERPHVTHVWLRDQKIGTIPYKKGVEPLKGVHLRRLLATSVPKSMSTAMALHALSNNNDDVPSPAVIIAQKPGNAGVIMRQALQQLVSPGDNKPGFAGISVVVCTRDRAHQLSNCITHLLALQYPAFEIIVVDNAPSNEDTRELASKLPVRYVREERPGLDWARNRGIAEAKYAIIAFTDDDVRVHPYWLQEMEKVFRDESVSGASGYVAPAELETPAQHLFESGYGGMGHGFSRRYFHKDKLSNKQLLWASSFGIGANMAFRKEIFSTIGGFDTALDVGTPSHGAGDVEMFHRLVAKGYLFVYEPSMLVWHHHRREESALKKQIFDNGRSFGCYLIDCFRKRTVPRSTILQFFFVEWFWKWNMKNLFSRKKLIPASYTFAELRGMMTSPVAYMKTRSNDRKIRRRCENVKM